MHLRLVPGLVHASSHIRLGLADELESAASEIEDLDLAGKEEPQELTDDQQDELVSRVEDIIGGIG